MALEMRKLYVGGLPPSAHEEELKEHFARYGEVLCARVVRHRDTGYPRGFAFVEFADDEGPRAALEDKEKANHVFGGRTVDVKRARVKPRYQTEQSFYQYNQNQSPGWYNQSSSNTNAGYAGYGSRSCDPNKVFIGGLRGNITKEDLKSYFGKFGAINDVVVICDGLTHKSRGFGFITFDSEDSMLKVLENSYHDLNGTKVETKVAIPKDHSYYHHSQQNSPMNWAGNSPSYSYGVYPPQNLHYIVTNQNHYMVPYMYPPFATGEYGYMPNTGAPMVARQGGSIYRGYRAPSAYDYVGTNLNGVYSVDTGSESKTNQVMTNQQEVDSPRTNTSKQEPSDSVSTTLL
ncbi:RNA-binding protein 1 [Brachypodium distachyon]|uniref:RRM domain-containing protein n=1 Tax=Brachypodium distachyon TaxID=15368 RepID=I1GMV1_BRADI|nr:RNA-binding protein 1 [Brachypodium distachyon]KQK12994.1 hypothetical protein BRADI_1g07300v3 [Brachypodium distachyon]|eukprot:XP_003558767.1 RNA-binding protein 1 [Brachypodium distachyon]